MRQWWRIACIGFLAFAVSAAAETELQPHTLVFISDLHLGLGRAAGGEWDPKDDFRWSGALTGFLDQIASDSGERTHLVILGDLLELWQPPSGIECGTDPPDLGCTVTQMEAITTHVVRSHRHDLEAMGAFAARGANRITIVPGNHDAALMLDSVWDLVLPAFRAPDGRVQRVSSGLWASEDGLIVAEHGHQIAPDVNRYEHWPTVTRVRRGESVPRMIRPWGEFFVQRLYNREEDRYPLIDNLAGSGAGVKYRMRDRGKLGTLRDVARFARLVVLESSVSQQRALLGEGEGAQERQWDVARARSLGYRLIADGLEPGDPLLSMLTARGFSSWRLRNHLRREVADPGSVSDDEIKALCDVLEQRRAEDPQNEIASCAPVELGHVIRGAGLIPKKRVLRRHLLAMRQFPSMLHYVYGHTHALEQPWTIDLGGMRTVMVANTGAFHRLIDEETFRSEAANHGLEPSEALKRLPLDSLPACYTAVVITYVGGRPRSDVKNWLEEGDRGHFVDVCDAACARLAPCRH